MIFLNDLIMKRVAFFLVCIYCLSACNNENMQGPEITTNEMKPQIALVMPDAETVNLYSTATASENTIDTIWVLAFNSSGDKQWVEKIPGSQITRNGYASQLLPQLNNEPQLGWTIVCIANVDPNPDTTTVTLTNINTNFRLWIKGYYKGEESLPMYGSFIWQPSTGYTCEMTRAVAKIQIQMGTAVSIADSIGNFSAENVSYRIYNGLGAGTIQQPTSGVNSGRFQFSSSGTDLRYFLQKENVTEQDISTYIFGFPSSTHYVTNDPLEPFTSSNPDMTFEAERLHIILEKDNGSNPTTYYRLDFYNPVTKKFLDIERNHHYLFTINIVRSEGYRTIEEALLNPASNIEYTIEIGDDATRMASNGQYAIVTTGGLDTVVFNLSAYDAPETVVNARFQLPAQMASLAPGTYNSIELQSIAPYSNAYYDLSPSVLTNVNTPITVKVRPAPASKPLDVVTFDDATGVLIFRLGNIKHQVYFKFTMN